METAFRARTNTAIAAASPFFIPLSQTSAFGPAKLIFSYKNSINLRPQSDCNPEELNIGYYQNREVKEEPSSLKQRKDSKFTSTVSCVSTLTHHLCETEQPFEIIFSS